MKVSSIILLAGVAAAGAGALIYRVCKKKKAEKALTIDFTSVL